MYILVCGNLNIDYRCHSLRFYYTRSFGCGREMPRILASRASVVCPHLHYIAHCNKALYTGFDAIWQFWRLEVRHKGQRMSPEEMAFNFAAIIEDGQKAPATDGASHQQHHHPRLGLLTTANRRLWAQWRHQLLQGAVVNSLLAPLVGSVSLLLLGRLFRLYSGVILYYEADPPSKWTVRPFHFPTLLCRLFTRRPLSVCLLCILALDFCVATNRIT